MSYEYEKKVIIIGKTGNGKSSLGNTLLGKTNFDVGRSFAAITKDCLLRNNENKDLTVVDTPGLFETDGTRRNLATQASVVAKAIEICPHPHAFLIVLNGSIRLSEEERSTVDVLKLTFGHECLKHAIIVFTHVENDESNLDFERRWKGSEPMKELVGNCGNRVARIDNKHAENKHINQIFKLIDQVSNKGATFYNGVYSTMKERIFEQEASIEKHNCAPLRKDVNEILDKMEICSQKLMDAENKIQNIDSRRRNWELAGEVATGAITVISYGIYFGATVAFRALQELEVRHVLDQFRQ